MKQLKLYLTLVFASSIIACEDETLTMAKPTPVGSNILQFEASEYLISETSESKTVKLNLSKPASTNGFAFVEVTSQHLNHFTTTPEIVDGKIKVTFAEGSTSATFAIHTVNNSILDGNKTASFKISSASEGFSIGSNKEVITTITDDEAPVQINFSVNQSTADEDASQAHFVSITLSQAATGSGTVEITLSTNNATYDEHFTTIPQAINGKIILPIASGDQTAEVKFLPVNNTKINEHTITFEITNVSGALLKGTVLQHTLRVNDDELKGISRSYSTSGGGWGAKRYYGYREDGKISKIYWEQYTPGYLGGSYSYEYNSAGELLKMIESAYTETHYTWENGRIIKAEKFTDGVLKQYTLYGYDEAGNVGEAAVYYRQPDGELKMGLLFVYLYYWDGNLYKQLTYNPVEGLEEPVLISTRTYENYLDIENLFPIEILPNVNSQPKLPGSYRIEENGRDILYTFFYEYNENGKVIRRTASSTSGNEISTYQYY